MVMTSSNKGIRAKRQHEKPCHDCPMRRDSLPGWLAMATPEEYVQLAHSDEIVDCHVIINQQCAGMAIYRRNVCKRVDPPGLVLAKDTETVFATPMEFLEYHNAGTTRPKPLPSRKGDVRAVRARR